MRVENTRFRRSEAILPATLDPQSKTAPRVSCANRGLIPQGLAIATEERMTVSSVPARQLIYTKPITDETAVILAPRIMRNIYVTPTGCWVRTVNVNSKTGYTNISIKVAGRAEYYFAHRVMYVYRKGQIPEGLTLDHLCEVPGCCNPEHLVPATLRDNVLRSKTNPSAINARKDFCSRGHSLYVLDERRRYCPTCQRETATRRRRERYAAGVPDGEPHGTRRSYHHWGCRCDECGAWQRADYARRKSEGRA